MLMIIEYVHDQGYMPKNMFSPYILFKGKNTLNINLFTICHASLSHMSL